jgi:predicted amidophosphoribosyltransferase
MSHLTGLVIDVEETNERGQPQLTVTEDGAEMLRLGYLCGRCLEDLRPLGAMPEKCPCCGFPVAKEQSRQYHRDFQGKTQVGSRLSLSDELERLGEMWIPPSA